MTYLIYIHYLNDQHNNRAYTRYLLVNILWYLVVHLYLVPGTWYWHVDNRYLWYWYCTKVLAASVCARVLQF